ncbi:MAG: hypothetical protein AAF587_36815 [Bacteroidota bacterium]
MPAQKKYLSSPEQRVLKITAGLIGGFLVTILFHNALGSMLTEKASLIITSAYSSFLIWTACLVFAFMAKNGWKIWAIYGLIMLVFLAIIYLP